MIAIRLIKLIVLITIHQTYITLLISLHYYQKINVEVDLIPTLERGNRICKRPHCQTFGLFRTIWSANLQEFYSHLQKPQEHHLLDHHTIPPKSFHECFRLTR